MQKTIYAIGVMSGTSLDGIDLVYTKFTNNNYKEFTIIAASTIAYSQEWKQNLQKAISFSKEKLQKLDVAYGRLIGETVNSFIQKNAINTLDFIASHGHTVFHQPQKGITLQIGNGQEIANITQHTVVCDFRTQDVELGGQGAPLVPIGDQLLFPQYDYCINLGGFANISYNKQGKRIAFDIAPTNIVLNHYTQQIGLEYDDEGTIAAKGISNQYLLQELNALSFYQQKPPKSLGLEWVQQYVFPLIDSYQLEIPSILQTFVQHTAYQIGKNIKPQKTILLTGGGAYNTHLVNAIAAHAQTTIQLPTDQLIAYKEALIFAFLGLLRIKNEVNCLQTVTGASKNHSSGKIFYP